MSTKQEEQEEQEEQEKIDKQLFALEGYAYDCDESINYSIDSDSPEGEKVTTSEKKEINTYLATLKAGLKGLTLSQKDEINAIKEKYKPELIKKVLREYVNDLENDKFKSHVWGQKP